MTATLAPVSFPALGTTAVVLAGDPAATAHARLIVEREIAAVDRACSRFRGDSELTRVNAGSGTAVAVSPVLLEALAVALRAAAVTGGLVDPTVGSAMRLLGYDRDFSRVPAEGPPIAFRATAVPGWRLVEIDRPTGTVRIPRGAALDLGATAKAWCADRAAEAAAGATGSGVLVSLGGDVAVAGPCPTGGWRVLIADDHTATLDSPGPTVAITSGGLATSGTAVRRWTRGGRLLHHLVDPATGLPAASPWRTVTVAAGSCTDANTASTAAIIIGAAAPQWLADRALPARLVATDGGVSMVAGWPGEHDRC